jgi:hypothetical protein
MTTYSLRMSGRQHAALLAHLFPGDGKEAVAVALCGRRVTPGGVTLLVHKLFPVAYADCTVREPDRLTWRTDAMVPVLADAARRGLAVLKIHSHPGGYDRFSPFDDASDGELFPSVFGWVDSDLPHGSAVMLPGGRVFGRAALPGGVFRPFARVAVAGDDLHFWDYGAGRPDDTGEALLRNRQLFGEGTMRRLKNLSVAVVGYSGTGSFVVEALARLGVGRLVIIEYDLVEEKNLNRIPNTTREDAVRKRPKAEVALRAIRAMGLGTEVEVVAGNLINPDAIRLAAGCDVLFGCVDSVEARHVMNKLATFYLLPYFDLGVRLDADGRGGIDQACGSSHYLQPGGSSLHSRGVYTMEEVRAEGLRRTDPAAYAGLVKEGYVRGVRVDRPAVISVNMLIAAVAVNDFLARLHPFRLDPNGEFAAQTVSLTQGEYLRLSDGEPCPMFAGKVGRGDVRPLLEMPELSEGEG